MAEKKNRPLSGQQRGGGKGTDKEPFGEGSTPDYSTAFQPCHFSLSPSAQTRLELLSFRTGIPPAEIVDCLVRGATPQLILVCATLTPRLMASGWRPDCVPLVFVVGQEGSDGA